MKIFFSCMIFLIAFSNTQAIEKDSISTSSPPLPYDDDYVLSLSKWITLKSFAIFDETFLQVRNKNFSGIPKYSPNIPFKIGFGFSYRWIGFSLAFKYPFAKDNSEMKGVTNAFELNLNTYGRWLAIDAYVQRYQGVYLRNPQSVYPNWQNGEPFPLREDVIIASAGANFIIVANPLKYSLKAATTYSEIQEKSAGSFIIAPYFNFIRISGDHTLAVGELGNNIDSDEKLIEGNFLSAGILPGFAFNLILNRFFFSTIANGGATLQLQYYSDVVDDKNRKAKLIFTPMIKTAIGYNSRRFITAFSWQYEIRKQPIIKTNYEYIVSSIKLSFGVRLNVNKTE